MANKVTLHFRDERADRATYIAQTVGFGQTVRYTEYYDNLGRFARVEIIETGVVIVRNEFNSLVTMYIARPEQLMKIYKRNDWGHVPQWLITKAQKNWKKGYTQNQPDYH